MNAEALKKLLDQYDFAYYNQNTSLVEDTEYDALKQRYLDLTNKEEYEHVPGAVLFNKIKHTHPILSLDKVKITEKDKLRSELTRLAGKVGIVIEPKFDGLTIVKYPDGRGVTRGTGLIGEDVTQNCLKVEGFKEIKSDTYPIRMEVFMPKSVFNQINEEREKAELPLFKNPRNAASGMIRNKDANNVRGLKAYAYDLVGYDLNQTAMLDTMEQDESAIITPYWFFKDIDEAMTFIETFDRNHLDYEIDGLVVKSNHKHSLTKFGMTGHHPKNAIAIKFVADEKWTKPTQVIWNVGRTGKVVPVLEFEPIDLMGTTVTRATLHNVDYINALGLNVDLFKKQVCITKANDIIPAVVNTRPDGSVHTCDLQSLDIPDKCPDCNKDLEKVNGQLYCRNAYCKEKIIAQAVHMVSREALDIRGLSEETIRKMYDILDKDGIATPTLAIGWSKEPLLEIEGFAEKSAQNLADEYDNKLNKEILFSKVLYATGIPLVGRTVSKLIAKHFKTFEDLQKDLNKNEAKQLLSINGIGPEVAISLKNHFDRIIDLVYELELSYDNFKIKSEYQEIKVATKDQKTFVITGTLEHPRSYYQSLIEEAGHKVSGSVSKKTSYLLAGEDAGSKLEKAKSLAIKIITTEEELKSLL